MVEPVVADLSRSIAWYAALTGWPLKLLDGANGFALLESAEGRISLKRGEPKPGSVRLHFEVANLDAEMHRLIAVGMVPVSALKSSDEGYRRAVFHDPDGNEISLFEWVRPCA